MQRIVRLFKKCCLSSFISATRFQQSVAGLDLTKHPLDRNWIVKLLRDFWKKKKWYRILQRSRPILLSAKTENDDDDECQIKLTLLDLSPLFGQHVISSDCPFLRGSDKTGTGNKAPFTPEHVAGQKVRRQLKLTLWLLLKSSRPWKIFLCPHPKLGDGFLKAGKNKCVCMSLSSSGLQVLLTWVILIVWLVPLQSWGEGEPV